VVKWVSRLIAVQLESSRLTGVYGMSVSSNYFAPGMRAKYCDHRVYRPVCIYVCVRPLAYLKNYMTELHEIFCICYMWPWLGPRLTTYTVSYALPVLYKNK